MYIPSSFKEENPDVLFDLIEKHNFGILFSQHQDKPEATHLPFMVDRKRGKHGFLIAHFAKANKHWRNIDEEKELMVVFQGPHTYISPSWYVDRAEVPTWNYATVHVYGKPTIINDPTQLKKMVTDLTHHHENNTDSDWSINEVSTEDLDKDLKAIVGLEIEITKLEGKFKFNQNKKIEDQVSVVKKLNELGINDVSEIMNRNLNDN